VSVVYRFQFDDRLGISIPEFRQSWQSYDKVTQEKILLQWEEIRGSIPEHIRRIEEKINHKQALLNNEANFKQACDINTKISELASEINDLWLWFRTNDVISEKNHH
jgi:gas vesicle protein